MYEGDYSRARPVFEQTIGRLRDTSDSMNLAHWLRLAVSWPFGSAGMGMLAPTYESGSR